MLWQSFPQWLQRLRRPHKPLPIRRPRPGRSRLQVEVLEDRVTPACVNAADPPPPVPFPNSPPEGWPYLLEDSTGAGGIYYVTLPDDFSLADAFAIVEAINEDPAADFRWSIGAPDLPFYIVTYVGVPCDDHCPAATTGTAAGQPIFVAAGREFAGVAATFEITSEEFRGEDDFTAEISWGDGSSTQGAVVQVGAGMFEVQGQHTYGLDGVYVMNVTIARTEPDCENDPTIWTTTAVAPALVFGLTQPESLQTIDWTTASITGGEEPDGQSGTGTYRYELHYAVQELYQHTHRDVSGWITFDELSFVAGESTTVRASAGEITTEYLTTYADLDAKYTRIGTDRYELNRLERDVNLETGTFSGAEEGVVTAQWRDDGKTVAGQQRLDNGAFRLPGHVHDLVGAFGANVEQTIGFARSEGGDFAAESYSRTDTRTINVTSWTVEGSDLLGDYEGTVTQDEIVDRVATAGAIGGAITVAQQYDYAAFDGTTHYELTWEDPVLGVDLELTEDDRVTFQRNVTADLAAHRYESKETRAIHYLAALTGSFAGDDVDLDPEVQTQRVINVTGDAQSGAYTRTTEFPQNQGPAVTDYEGEGYDWQLTERNLRHVETGNYLQRTFTSEESREVTVDAVETVSGAEGPPVEVRLRAVDQRSVSAAGNFNDAVARTTKHAISDAQLTTTGIVDDHTLSDMSVLAARFITAVKGGPGVLKLFQSQARTYDGVPLPIGAKREITIPSINFEAAVYGDLTGTFIIAGFRTAAAATISAGFNDPFYAVMAELKGSVEVFAQIGNAALGGTYLEVNVGAAFNYYKELANPRSLGDLSNLLPETLRNLDLSRARELLSQLPISSLGKPPTQLEGAPAPEGVQGEQHLQDAKLRSEVDQAALADAQGRLTQTPTPLDFSKIAGFSSVPVPPPTVASQLPTRSITAYQLSFTVGLKIGNKIVDALNKTIGSVAYLKAGLEYNFIDHYDEKTQWFDSEGVVIQERTVERNGTSTDVTVEGRVGLEGRLEVGATYVPLHQGEFTTTTVETNQTHKSVTVETSKESGSSLSFFAIVDGKENSVAQSTNTATIIRDVTITNASQSDYRLTRHEEETTNTSSTVVTAFGLVGFSAATGKSRAVSEELEVNQTQTTKVNETSNERWTSTRLSTGLTGSYSETSRREGDYALSRRLTNQSLTVLRTENGSYSSDGTSEGNQLVGLTYDTTETEKSSYTATELETNGPDVVARTEKGSETGTWRSTGRSTAGEYRVALAGPSSARVEIGEVQTNHTLRVERTITRDTETVAYLEVGNQQTGVYVLNDEEKATVVIHEESFNQDAATISDHRTETTTSMADVGNSIGGAYDLRVTETTTLGRSSSTYSNRGHTIESERLIVQGSSQQREIGNAVTGDYEITGGSSESFRETVTDSNRGRIVGRTVTGDESGDNTETGNDLTGVYIASDNYTGGTTTGSTETILDLLVGLSLTVAFSGTASEAGNFIVGTFQRTSRDEEREEETRNESNNGLRRTGSRITTTVTTGASSGNTVTGADRDEAATVRDSAENGTETNLELLVTSTATSKTTTTAREDGNVVSGDYELTATETTVAASSVSRTNRELVITSTVTSDGSSTTTETGNSFAGAFVLQTAGSGVTNEVEVETNQGLRMESRTTAASVSGMLDRGNSVTGDHDLATDDGTTTVSTVVKTNGPLTVNTTLTVTSAVSAAETSNEHSGEYELTATETTVVQETSEQTNGELTAGSATDATSTVTTEEAGNTVTGDFEAFVSTTSHSAVVSHLANQGLRSDTKATTAVEGEADESGNTVAGDATRQGTDTVITVTEVTSVNGALTAKAKTTVTDKVESTDTSNSITGVFSKHVTVNRTITGTSTDVNGPLTVTGETEGAEEGTTAETGNTLDGSYEITEDWTGSVTVSQEGRNGVRTWEVTQTTETTLRHVEQTGNDLSGAFTYDETTAQTVTVEETATFSNGGQDTLGRETTNDVTLRETGNVVTGEYERSVEKTTQATTQQAGQRGGGAYTATATEDGRFASVETGNTLTGAFHAEESSRTTTERRQTAPFTLTVSSTLTVTGERDGNQISGAYGSEATIREDETLAERGNGFSVDQTRTVATTETETGNSVTGSYGADLTRRTTLSYTQTSGPLFVTQSSQENESGTRTGNRIAGTFSEVVSGTETYQLRENGSIGPNNFNLTANGTRRFSTTLTTDERTGGYSKSETGTETVSMLETGTRQVRILNRPRNLAFREQLNVNATYQQQESGNVVSGAFTRTTAGRDNFRRIETGLGALLEHILQPVGQANFAVTENGNLHTGQLNLSKTGTTRYDLLVLFGDASTTNGKGPGTVSFVPVGRPYHVGEGQISSGDGGGNAGTALGEISDGQLLAMAQSLEAYVQLGAEDYYKACFAAGTPIRTRAGWKLIEDIAVGDEVWSRHERDPDGPLALKHVEELFLRQAAVWHLHVGGEVLRTTAEHPFWVRGLGWRQCQELKVGQELRTADGWIVVEDVCDAGEWLPVYNFRVAEWHTYFVGDDARQAIWVHNSIYDVETKLSDVSNTRQSKVRQAFALAAQAEATSMSLKGDFRGKCVAASNGRNTISGYEETGQPPGFEAITPDQVAKQAALIGYPLRGHGNDSSGSGPSWSGKYFASHAEKKMAVANLSNLSLPIGVSQDQCTDCGAGSGANPNSFFRSLAMAKGMDLVVASPTTARIFTSTGTVLLFRQ